MTVDPLPPRSARRESNFDAGQIAKWHDKVIERAADVALAAVPVPLRVLDVGCGDGALLREVLIRVPYGDSYVGLDPLREMITAALAESDGRIAYVRGAAGALPFPPATFDLVVSSASFDLWADQAAGIRELARVVKRRGKVVLVEVSAGWRRRKGLARTPKQVRALLREAGLQVERRETMYRLGYVLPMVRAFIASP